MAARAAIRDAGRALGLPYEFCDRTAKLIPMFATIEKTLAEVKEFKDIYESGPEAKRLIDSAKRLEGVARHASMHACGVVITREPVSEYTPLQKIVGKESGAVTQYSSSTKYSFIEKIGLLKMDFLGLKNLTIIQNALRIVRKTRGLEIDINNLPLDDQKTYDLFQKGQTTGVFQFESSGMKRYLKQLKPTNIEDIIAMAALYRPGPMDWIPDFIAQKNGEKQVRYLHPKLKPILEKTYGVAVYQEQVMQSGQQLAGFSLGEADVLRKAMGKKIFALVQEQKIKFIDRCQKEGVDKSIAEKVFAFIEPFAGYGFNRSHAACYGVIGYQTAYLKAHFPAAFMAALLTSDQDDIDRIAIEVAECREMGIEVLPPNVNESFEEFAVIVDPEDKKERIRFGLNAVKNVGHTVAHEIVEERKKNGRYKSLTDLVERVRHKDLNKKSIEALAKVGALDELERNAIVMSMENILNHSKNIEKLKNTSQFSLFGEEEIALPPIPLVVTAPASKKEKLAWEKELIGLYISDHPVKEFQDYLDKMAVRIRNISKEYVGRQISVGGVISKVQRIQLKTMKTMLFVTIEDIDANMEVLVFPKILETTGAVWQPDKVVLVSGKISDKDGVFKILADSAKTIDTKEVENFRRVAETQKKNGQKPASSVFIESQHIEEKKNESQAAGENYTRKKLIITLPQTANKDTFKTLSQYFDKCQFGSMKVYLEINGSKLETPYCITKTDELENQLKNLVPDGKIQLL
jgi:DNA polymerase-3 subunit alpha